MVNEIDILLSRYFSGEASENELHELDCWLAESDENEKYFEQMTSLFQQSAMMPDMPKPDMASALSDFNDYMSRNRKIVPKRKLRTQPLLQLAVACVILLVGIFTFYTLYQPLKVVNLVTENAIEEHTLFEDATVVLEANSQIRFSADKKNEVELLGKATFTVEAQQEQKLLVQAGETFIRDIGTVFTVTAYNPNELITVEVFEGEVQFFTSDNTGVLLTQNETAVYNPQTKQFTITNIEETIDEITFVATPLHEVAEVLSSYYGVNINIQSEPLNDMQISVSFDKHESIENILEIVAETLGLNISKVQNEYVIR